KYLNTPETDLYKKRTLLYGMHLALQPIVETGSAIVVEGYTDAITAHQAGFTNVVATAGISLTAQHLAAPVIPLARSCSPSTVTKRAFWQSFGRLTWIRPTAESPSSWRGYPRARTLPTCSTTAAAPSKNPSPKLYLLNSISSTKSSASTTSKNPKQWHGLSVPQQPLPWR
ncbi:MAG: toprim domain-containing protein, partial [Acidimicrobiia bacterium]